MAAKMQSYQKKAFFKLNPMTETNEDISSNIPYDVKIDIIRINILAYKDAPKNYEHLERKETTQTSQPLWQAWNTREKTPGSTR